MQGNKGIYNSLFLCNIDYSFLQIITIMPNTITILFLDACFNVSKVNAIERFVST